MIRIKVERIVMTVAILLFVSVFSVQAQENPLEDLDAYIEKSMKQWQVPGVAVAIVKDDKVVLAKGYGTRTYGKNEPVDENTLFAIGSQTKTFTATALAMLVGEGKLGWDDRMIERLPGFKVQDDVATSYATIRDALSHRSGVREIGEDWHMNPSLSRKEVLQTMKYLPPANDFRSGYHYSNKMFLAAGEIVPEVTGISWDDFIETRIFKVLGMKNSNTSITKFGFNNNVATPHIPMIDNDKAIIVPYHNIDSIGPAGSINSSAIDMAQWLRFQLNNGKLAEEVIVAEHALNETRQIHNTVTGANEGLFSGIGMGETTHGLGVFINELEGYKVYQHAGAIDGHVSMSAFVPELDLGVVVLANLEDLYSMALLSWILNRYIGANEIDWTDALFEGMRSYNALKKEEKIQARIKPVPNTKPSLLLSEYTGVYTNDALGELVITLEDDSLVFKQGEVVQGKLNHLHFDTFLAHIAEPVRTAWILGEDKPMQFHLGLSGTIKRISTAINGVDITYVKND